MKHFLCILAKVLLFIDIEMYLETFSISFCILVLTLLFSFRLGDNPLTEEKHFYPYLNFPRASQEGKIHDKFYGIFSSLNKILYMYLIHSFVWALLKFNIIYPPPPVGRGGGILAVSGNALPLTSLI